jgi:hypothetical protein
MDGPVVTAARKALERDDVGLILPFVKASGEPEVREAFERAIRVRNGDPLVNEVTDLYFFDTVVRVHRAGEGAPYTGLKPAGLSTGPVIPVCERAIETGDPSELIDLLTAKVTSEIHHRLGDVTALRAHAAEGVEAGRAYVEAMLGLEVWSHKVYGVLVGSADDEPAAEIQGHG